MTTLLTRMFRTDPARARFCADCQVGQGRGCACRRLPVRKVGFRWPRVSDTTIVLALLVYDVLALVGAWHLMAWMWRAFA